MGNGTAYPGVAPGADLIPIQVFSEFTGSVCGSAASPCPLSYVSDQVAALEYVFDTLRFSHTIASVNMSLGGAPSSSQAACDAANAATKAAIDNLRSVGIATVIAAGNQGYVDAISEPACISSAVSVAATGGPGQIAAFSNAASFLSLCAPGVSIRAPLFMSSGFIDASGTSMAAPHVAGAWAALKQYAPSAGVDEILAALQATGEPCDDVYAHTKEIRIAQALQEVLPACANGIDDDGDRLVDDADPGCDDGEDGSERSPAFACDNGEDDDGDGLIDFLEDPGCFHPTGNVEAPACQDGIDNDGDGGIDYDGGPAGTADPDCIVPWLATESCGLGAELALMLPLLAWLRGRTWSKRA
jgi:hypothetical protein